MAGGLYGRVASRGFPSSVAEGMTGAGALASQGGPYSPAHGQAVAEHGQFSTLPGFQPEPVASIAVDLLEGTWGLPGTVEDPDQTPGYGPGTFRSHAAPFPGWAGSYSGEEIAVLRENSTQIHGEDFGALPRHVDAPPDGGDLLPMSPWSSLDYGQSNLQPLSGQIRAMGGYDSEQGYGGGGSGPGGVNGHGFGAGHRNRLEITGNVVNTFVDAAERPYIVPQAAGSFTPTDAVQGPGPHSSMLAADGLSYNDPTTYAPPAEPATMSAPLPGGAASAGWWG